MVGASSVRGACEAMGRFGASERERERRDGCREGERGAKERARSCDMCPELMRAGGVHRIKMLGVRTRCAHFFQD